MLTEGGGGVQKTLILADVICEQPLIVLCTFESVVLVNHFPQTLQADEDVERGAQGDESAVGPSFFVRTLLTGLHIFISLVTNDNFQLRTCDPSLCPRVLPI